MIPRSIGDLELKKYGVTARPELRSVRIKHGKDQFLAFTSDGINFVMRDEEVVDCINKCEGAKEGAARLVDQVGLLKTWWRNKRCKQKSMLCIFKSGNVCEAL